MAEEKEINPVIFWLQDFNGECVGGFKKLNPLATQFKELIDQGLTPVGIKYDGTVNIDIIIAKDQSFDAYLELQKVKKPNPIIKLL